MQLKFTPPGSSQTYQWKKSEYLKKLAMEAKLSLDQVSIL